MQEQLGQEDCGSEDEGGYKEDGGTEGVDEFDGEVGEMPAEMAGRLVCMGEERIAKRVDRLREQGRRKRGRPQFIWEDCVRRDISKVGVVGEWRELAEDRWGWRSIIVKAGQKLGAIIPHTL